MKSPVHIEICGGIGVGKSTLAQRLSKYLSNSEIAFEDFRSNTLWHRYYETPQKYVREKNISFLAQHFAELKYSSAPILIADFSPVQDLAYAAMVRDVLHYEVMSKIYTDLRKHSPAAKIFLVHLVTTLDQQSMQIKARGRKEELSLTPKKLSHLNSSLVEILKTESKNMTVIEIDISAVDLRKDNQIIFSIEKRILDEGYSLLT